MWLQACEFEPQHTHKHVKKHSKMARNISDEIHVHVVSLHNNVYIQMYICTTYIHTYIHICTCTYACTCKYMYIYVVHTCTCTYVYVHIHKYIQSDIHVHYINVIYMYM